MIRAYVSEVRSVRVEFRATAGGCPTVDDPSTGYGFIRETVCSHGSLMIPGFQLRMNGPAAFRSEVKGQIMRSHGYLFEGLHLSGLQFPDRSSGIG